MEKFNAKVVSMLFPKKGQPQPDNGYAIVAVAPEDKGLFGDEIIVKGNMPGVRVGQMICVGGYWKTDSYGKSFVAQTYEEVMPTSTKGIENYLASGMIYGIGPVLAKTIVDVFGEKTLDIIDKQPQKLYDVPGIGAKKVAQILESWEEQKGIRDVMVFLKTYGVGNAVAAKIYKKYKDRSIATIKENPYVLADEIEGVGFLTADTIALNMGLDRQNKERVRCGVLYAMKEDTDKEGHTFSLLGNLIGKSAELLNNGLAREDGDAVTDGLIAEVVRMMEERRDVIIEGDAKDRIYLPYFYNAEKNVAARVRFLLKQQTLKVENIDFGKLESTCGISFDDVQKDAITLAANSHLCIITGGPGTGKTTTMKGVIAEAQQRKLSVVLAAPTGRAAKRLSETTGMSASTIHRLLEYSPANGFGRDEETPLDGDILVVDESSMIDIMLMNHLLKAVHGRMKVVFVGDVDQLPSVGAGNVLRDMIECGKVPVIRLTRIFRQAQDSLIVSNAHRINEGKAISLPCNLTPEGEDFCFIECNDSNKIQEHILNIVPKYIPEMFDIEPEDVQVLTPMKKGSLGTEELNRLLQEKINPNKEGLKRGTVEFRKGDRVMQIKNNYDWDVYNGDIGTILSVNAEERTLTIDFQGKTVIASNDQLDQLLLAYACTIHKSQGSEYPVVVIPVTMGHYIMLVRNLLYTAVTRAKKRCVLVGEKKAIMTMIGNNVILKRNSALQEKIGRM